MLMVVNDVCFSMEVWDWYHNRKDKFSKENNAEINVYREWLLEQHNSLENYVSSYGELNGWDFFEFFKNIFMLYTGIHPKPLDQKFSFQDQHDELMAIEKMLLYWVFTEGHEKEDFGPDMRKEYLDSNRMAFNQKFHVECCYMMKAIWHGFHELKKKLKNIEIADIEEITVFDLENVADDNTVDEFMKKVIRQAYGGDFDEFIISVMERIKYKTMNENHEKLAKVKAYELFGKEDFDQKIPESESWRMLFNTYFDDVEDIYHLFYEKFIGDCIMYVFIDYLSWDEKEADIVFIPVYKRYCNIALTKNTKNIRWLIDMEKIKKRIKQLYKIRI